MENRIKQLREEMHMTQIRLSIELEVAQETISAYESGKHFPSTANLIRLTQIFHTSCDYLLGLSNVRFPEPANNLSPTEHLFLLKFQNLNERQQERLMAYMDGLLDQ